MKTKLAIVCMIIMLLATSCGLLDTGKAVFYTNAQAMLDCGPFNVDIYIGEDFVGSITDFYLEESSPDCINSAKTVMVEKDMGVYEYRALANCGQYGAWSGKVRIMSNSCSVVFLDLNDCNPKED